MKLIYWAIAKNSGKKAAIEGTSKLYIDHIKMLCDIVISLGKIPVLWADIALKHPESFKAFAKANSFYRLELWLGYEQVWQSSKIARKWLRNMGCAGFAIIT